MNTLLSTMKGSRAHPRYKNRRQAVQPCFSGVCRVVLSHWLWKNLHSLTVQGNAPHGLSWPHLFTTIFLSLFLKKRVDARSNRAFLNCWVEYGLCLLYLLTQDAALYKMGSSQRFQVRKCENEGVS